MITYKMEKLSSLLSKHVGIYSEFACGVVFFIVKYDIMEAMIYMEEL